MDLPKTVVSAALAHANEEYPNEACGVVIVWRGRRKYVRCKNISPRPKDGFRICPIDYSTAEDAGEIVAIVHSHPNASANPSQDDIVACEASGVPWFIVGLPSGVWKKIEPSGYVAPLVGREFFHGTLDCYGLVRDYYRLELGIDLPNFEREDNWWAKGGNLYVENFRAAGFEQRPYGDAPQIGDVLLMQVCADVPNHAAIYIGDDTILHHLYGRLSSREIYGGYYKKHTTHVLNYVGKIAQD